MYPNTAVHSVIVLVDFGKWVEPILSIRTGTQYNNGINKPRLINCDSMMHATQESVMHARACKPYATTTTVYYTYTVAGPVQSATGACLVGGTS